MSEPSAGIVWLGEVSVSVRYFFLLFNELTLFFFYCPLSQNEGNEFEWLVRLCSDVLFELLRYGSRCRLTKLEWVGQRFHRIIGNFFGIAPFLRLNFDLDPRFFMLYLPSKLEINERILKYA